MIGAGDAVGAVVGAAIGSNPVVPGAVANETHAADVVIVSLSAAGVV